MSHARDKLGDLIKENSDPGMRSTHTLAQRPEVRDAIEALLRRQIEMIQDGSLKKPLSRRRMLAVLNGMLDEPLTVKQDRLRVWILDEFADLDKELQNATRQP